MSNIEWTGETWNPIVGCSIKSPGCKNCFAMPMAARLASMASRPDGTGNFKLDHYHGLTEASRAGPVWTGKLALSEEGLLKPLKRKKPQTYFVNSMGDLFHEDCPDDWIDQVFINMSLCPQHTFQILTKRADRMRDYLSRAKQRQYDLACYSGFEWIEFPLKNVWLGVSVEDQKRADERIPDLLQTPAAVRWISAEPLLEDIWLPDEAFGTMTVRLPQAPSNQPDIGLSREVTLGGAIQALGGSMIDDDNGLDWVVCGGESGHKARPFKEEWMRSLYEQCREAGVPFFAKQMGGAVKSKLPPIPDDLLIREFPA